MCLATNANQNDHLSSAQDTGCLNGASAHVTSFMVAILNSDVFLIQLIQIRFSDPFRIHQHTYGEPCGGDYLIIYDGGATSSRKVDEYRATYI